MSCRSADTRAVPPPISPVSRRFLIALGALVALTLPPAPSAAQAPASPSVRAEAITPGGRRAERRLARGVASYYARSLHGNRTANGERYNHHAMTVAHRSLPFGTLLRVRVPSTGRRVLVRVNDRGPFVHGRTLDLSGAAADRLRMRGRGTARVAYEIVDPATLPSRTPPPPRKTRHV